MADTRDIEHFLQNPHELPSSLEELEKLVTGMQPVDGETTADPADKTGETGAASSTKPEVIEAAADQVKNDGKQQAEPPAAQQVLKSKDGKHEIPYSVLQSEREQRRTAEQAVQNLQQQLAALQAQAKSGQPAAEQPKPEQLSNEDLEAISEDLPAVGKLIKGLMAKVDALQGELGAVRESEGSRRQREASQASTTVQEAIDANPTLLFWQEKDPDSFQRAIQFDNQIKADARNRGLSLDERFAKVVSAMEAVYGPTELPDEYRREEAPTPAPAPAAKKNAAQAPAAPIAAPKPAPAARPEVASLSDIPGGVPPESDEITQLGLLSAADLGNKFMTMNPNDVLRILAKAA